MEFLDEYDESRPRIVFQSRPKNPSTTLNSSPNSQKNKPLLIISLTLSLIFLTLSLIFLQSQILNPICLWLFISFLVGPFAPISITAGDIRVGQGKIVEFYNQVDPVDEDESKKKVVGKRNRGKRSDFHDVSSNGSFDFAKNSDNSGNLEGFKADNNPKIEDGSSDVVRQTEWNESDLALLRKQLVKYPVGKPKRWEVISEAFKGKYSTENVISKAKSLGKGKPEDSESFSRFLKDRKVDKKVEGVENEGSEMIVWSSSEDIALLNALKSFPKEVAMRWEKISGAVPEKSKAACMKRVTDLKKEFRSSKGS